MAEPVQDPFGLEETVFEAALAPEKWPHALQRVSQTLGACGGVLFSRSPGGVRWAASPGIFPIIERFVSDGWSTLDSRLQRTLEKRFDLELRFVTEAELFAPGEMELDPLFTEFLWPNGLGHSAWMTCDLGTGGTVVLDFERELRQGPFPPDALERLNRLGPHLRRAAFVGAEAARQREHARLEAFSSIGLAAVALSAEGDILNSNGEFTAATTAWTPVRSGRLAVSDPVAADALHEALATLREVRERHAVPLRYGEEHVRAVLHLFPSGQDLFSGAAAIAVLTTSAAGKLFSPVLLRRLFDLTPSEANIASRIAAGQSVEEMAAADAKSAFTIRNQVKSILAKTGSRRQQDLVRLVTELLLPRNALG